MSDTKVKRHSLFPVEYDEISLVDDGAAGSANVLIFKRSRVSKDARSDWLRAHPPGSTPPTKPTIEGKKKRKTKKTPAATIGTTLSGPKKKKKGGRSQSNPCSTKTNSSGKGDDPNWKEQRHPRDEQGQFDQTSSDSKKKYGKGGTTKSKLDAACRSKGGKPKSGGKEKKDTRTRSEKMRDKYANSFGGTPKSSSRRNKGRKNKQGGRGAFNDGPRIRKVNSSMSLWDSNTMVLDKMERMAR